MQLKDTWTTFQLLDLKSHKKFKFHISVREKKTNSNPIPVDPRFTSSSLSSIIILIDFLIKCCSKICEIGFWQQIKSKDNSPWQLLLHTQTHAYLVMFLLVSRLCVKNMIRAFWVLVDVIYESWRQCDFFLHCIPVTGIIAAILLRCVVFICQDFQIFFCSFIPMRSWGGGGGAQRYTNTHICPINTYVLQCFSINCKNKVFYL